MASRALRVLLVDDERLIRWSIGQGLAREGCAVTEATTGEQALELVATTHPHLMLLDVRLPGIDGLTALRRALELCPDLVVVMMSAHGTVDVAIDAMKHGAADFLAKPFPIAPLPEVIERALTTAATRDQIVGYAAGVALRGGCGAGLIGTSEAVAELREAIAQLAASDGTSVLIEGESGTGKEVMAKAIHAASPRAGRPFLKLNCSALPETLLESELFGHEKGAFTGAVAPKRGLFEAAEGGTVMLDEVEELPKGAQAKLLRLLEARTFRRLGGVEELSADARVIATTNTDLGPAREAGHFRDDLYYRLGVVRVRVPPLRERPEDVTQLCAFFVACYNHQLKREVRGVSAEALKLMRQHGWPGNARELRNAVERAFVLHPSMTELRPEHLPSELREWSFEAPAGPAAPATLAETERRLIVEAMDRCRGNQSHAARLLSISRETLRYRLKKHGML